MSTKPRAHLEEAPISKSRLRLWLKLLKASNLVENELKRRLRNELNTTMPRFDVMAALQRSAEGMKMSEISRYLMVSNGNITGIVDKLTEEGLVLRVAVPGDRRANRVMLTSRGQKVFEQQAATHEAWVNEILGGLHADDVEGMIQRLDHMTDSLEESD